MKYLDAPIKGAAPIQHRNTWPNKINPSIVITDTWVEKESLQLTSAVDEPISNKMSSGMIPFDTRILFKLRRENSTPNGNATLVIVKKSIYSKNTLSYETKQH